MSNNASSAFALETHRAPSYALQHQSVVGYTPSGIIGTDSAPSSQDTGITFHTVPGQPVGDESMCLRLPVGSRVTQIVAEAVFPNDLQGQVTNNKFIIGLGEQNKEPKQLGSPENLNYLFKDVTGQALSTRVMKDAEFVFPDSVDQGSVGYVSKSPASENNYVNLGNGTGGGFLNQTYMRGAEFKVTITYVVIRDNAESHLALASNQARPSVRGA